MIFYEDERESIIGQAIAVGHMDDAIDAMPTDRHTDAMAYDEALQAWWPTLKAAADGLGKALAIRAPLLP